jgi:hypothetical protein
MVERRLPDLFPRLRGRPYQVTSPRDPNYNCVAFAAGDTQAWWWPDEAGEDTWPDGVIRAETIEAFRDAFRSLGYRECESDQHEEGFERIALFALDGRPKHAARQLPNGRWTSKLGCLEDIEHGLEDLMGALYGSVSLVMKRPIAIGQASE